MKISEILQKYIQDGGLLSGPGGKFTGYDFQQIQAVLDETIDNFIVFDNRGGKPFSIILFGKNWDNLKSFEKFAEDNMSYIFMKKNNGKETIIKNLPK